MINERIITCINLFNSCNLVEDFLDNIIKITKKIIQLPDNEKIVLSKINRKKFTDEEKESTCYKIYEELLNINEPSTDYIQKMIISLSALFITLHKENILEKDSNKNLSILVDTASYKEILNHFCIKKDNKYYIDEI